MSFFNPVQDCHVFMSMELESLRTYNRQNKSYR